MISNLDLIFFQENFKNYKWSGTAIIFILKYDKPSNQGRRTAECDRWKESFTIQ